MQLLLLQRVPPATAADAATATDRDELEEHARLLAELETNQVKMAAQTAAVEALNTWVTAAKKHAGELAAAEKGSLKASKSEPKQQLSSVTTGAAGAAGAAVTDAGSVKSDATENVKEDEGSEADDKGRAEKVEKETTSAGTEDKMDEKRDDLDEPAAAKAEAEDEEVDGDDDDDDDAGAVDDDIDEDDNDNDDAEIDDDDVDADDDDDDDDDDDEETKDTFPNLIDCKICGLEIPMKGTAAQELFLFCF